MATQRRRNRQTISQKALFGGNKVTSSNNSINEAKRQTRADKQAYKKDRANGDKEMKNLALEIGDNYKSGGPKNVFGGETPSNGYKRKAVDVGDRNRNKFEGVPNSVTKRKDPPYIQSQKQEMEDLKRMEGYDELKKKKGKRT